MRALVAAAFGAAACGGARSAPGALPASARAVVQQADGEAVVQQAAGEAVVQQADGEAVVQQAAGEAASDRRIVMPRSSAGFRTVSAEQAAAWQPSMPAPPTGGECMPEEMPEPGVSRYSLFSRNPDSSTNMTSVLVDGSGKALRYSEARGVPRVLIMDTGLSPAARDSAVRAQIGMGPRTVITLDYVTGDATAINADAAPDAGATGVRGRTAAFDTLPAMGPPRARVAAVLAACAPR
jgi:hypothetical protein